MFVGPVFNREVVIAPRRTRLYISRTSYVAALLVIMFTAWLVLTGTQSVRNLGDLARFGTLLFQLLAPLQLGLAFFFAALSAGSAVAQEKDRGTLVLLLLSRLTDSELVLGKLLAGMLSVLVLLLASLPLFMLSALLGGISFGQIGSAMAVTLASALAAGSIGSTLGLWREKTFQTLALTLLALVFWLALGELIDQGALGNAWAGRSAEDWAVAVSPWHAIRFATRPMVVPAGASWYASPVLLFVLLSLALAVVLNGIGIVMVRVWNPSREARAKQGDADQESIWGLEQDVARAAAATGVTATEILHRTEAPPAQASVHAAPGTTRQPWDNPVLWREIRTWAYGRKVLMIRLGYLALVVVAAAALYQMGQRDGVITRQAAAVSLVPLVLLSLILVNAQAVTSITSERDTKALDLLLVTDLSPGEFVFGKLGGVLYNTKEMVLLPLALCCYLSWTNSISLENLAYLLGVLVVLYAFVAMLGLHAGLSYDNSRSAIGVSLGTVFFLFVGIAVCMWMMVAFSNSFSAQLAPFATFIAGGTLGLYAALGARIRSGAILLASLGLPIFTFYAITGFLMQNNLAVFVVTTFVYGFTTAAMLVPALAEFDVSSGRTSSGDE